MFAKYTLNVFTTKSVLLLWKIRIILFIFIIRYFPSLFSIFIFVHFKTDVFCLYLAYLPHTWILLAINGHIWHSALFRVIGCLKCWEKLANKRFNLSVHVLHSDQLVSLYFHFHFSILINFWDKCNLSAEISKQILFTPLHAVSRHYFLAITHYFCTTMKL